MNSVESVVQVVEALRPRVRCYAARRGIPHTDCDDFAQEVAIRTWAYATRHADEIENVTALFVDTVRLRGGLQGRLGNASPIDVCVPKHAKDRVEAFLAAMEPTPREALLLKYVYGWCDREIACVLDSTPAAVRVSNYRWRKRIRQAFAPRGNSN